MENCLIVRVLEGMLQNVDLSGEALDQVTQPPPELPHVNTTLSTQCINLLVLAHA